MLEQKETNCPTTPLSYIDPYEALLNLEDQMRALNTLYQGGRISYDFVSLIDFFERTVARVDSQRSRGTEEEKMALFEQYVWEHYKKTWSTWSERLRVETEVTLCLEIELRKKLIQKMGMELHALTSPTPPHATATTSRFFTSEKNGKKRKKSHSPSETLVDSMPITDNSTPLEVADDLPSKIVDPSKK